MMKLGLMLQLDQAFTDRSTITPAEEVLKGWAHDVDSARVMRMSSNVVVRFTQNGQRRILRLTPATRRCQAEVTAEMAYIEHVAVRGIRANRPVASFNGSLVETVETSWGPFHACVLEYMKGDEVELENMTPMMVEAWGASLGRLHGVSEGWPGDGRPTWRTAVSDTRLHLKEDDVVGHRALAAIEHRLGKLPVDTTTYGLIHGDFELDNLLWNEGAPGIIDFDDCAGNWYAMDIACALRDLWDDRISRIDLTAPSLLSFVRGYRSVCSISDEELDLIPLFLGFHTLVTYAELCDIVAEKPSPSEPDWVVGIRDRLQSKVALYTEELSRFV